MEEPEKPDHARCRNLVHEISPRDGRRVPGRYCENRLGIVQVLDCPVFQGLPCCLYAPRAEDEPPRVLGEEEIETLRARLAEDFLRWPYSRRVELLRGAEPPPEKTPLAVIPDEEPEPEASDEEITPAALALPPPAAEEPPAEKYPGQRRSEDRFRSRRDRRTDGGADVEEEGPVPEPLLPPVSLDPEPEPKPPPAPPPGKPEPSRGGPGSDKRRGRRRRRGRGGGPRPERGGPAPAGGG